MSMRTFSIILALALVAGVFSALPAGAQTEPGATGGVVPAAPNVVDPADDANMGALPVTFTGMDVLAGWLTHDATNVYMHIQTTTGARAEATTFQTNVGTAAGLDCIQLRMTTAGEGNDSFSAINVAGDCGDVPTTQYGPLLEEVGPDDTAILTGTFPRDGITVLADGALLAEPDILVGFWGHGNPAAGGSRIGAIDTTEPGTDYRIGGSSAPVVEPAPEEPGKEEPKPGKGKGCKKGKGKKKGCKPKENKPKPPPAPSCPAYVPGEQGAEAETTIVTDAATEEKPVVVELTQAAGGPNLAPAPIDETSHTYQNVQVDSAAAEAGLWVRIEFTNGHDYDLYLRHPDGSAAANSGESQPVAGVGGGSEGGHEGGSNFEMITGMRTADCAGFTTDVVGFLTTGGPVTLSYWLGETKFDGNPPPAAGEEEALSTFYSLLGI